MDIPRDWITTDVYAVKYRCSEKAVKHLVACKKLKGQVARTYGGTNAQRLYVEDRDAITWRPKPTPRHDGKIRCANCLDWLNVEEFYKQDGREGSLKSQCKLCVKTKHGKQCKDSDLYHQIIQHSAQVAHERELLSPIEREMRENRISYLIDKFSS